MSLDVQPAAGPRRQDPCRGDMDVPAFEMPSQQGSVDPTEADVRVIVAAPRVVEVQFQRMATADPPPKRRVGEERCRLDECKRLPRSVQRVAGGMGCRLTAAHLLHEAGINAHLFEAAGRVGGRIDTIRDTCQNK